MTCHRGPVIEQHTYWKQKARFQLAQDTYAEWVLFAVEEGAFFYQIGEESGEAGAGTLVICPPNTPFRRKTQSPLTFHFLRFRWPDAFFPEHIGLSEWPMGKIFIRDRERFASNCSYLRALAFAESDVHLQWKSHLLLDWFYQHAMESSAVPVSSRQPETFDPVINQAVNFFHENIGRKISIKNLAASLGVSPVQFTRRFQASLGMTPMAYLTALRMQKARKYLLETDDTLDSIAERCGYQSGFYLSRVFARHMKMGPSQFRKTHQI